VHRSFRTLQAAIARLEASIAIDAISRRFPNMQRTGEETWYPTLMSRGMKTCMIDLGKPSTATNAHDL
jgi:cytochrome P450